MTTIEIGVHYNPNIKIETKIKNQNLTLGCENT